MEVTDEMVEAFGRAWHKADEQLGTAGPRGSRRRAGIKAVLDIVERDRTELNQRSTLEG